MSIAKLGLLGRELTQDVLRRLVVVVLKETHDLTLEGGGIVIFAIPVPFAAGARDQLGDELLGVHIGIV